MKVNVKDIQPAWSCCAYKLQIWVDESMMFDRKYVVDTLRKWFGDAEYFWDNCYLACKK